MVQRDDRSVKWTRTARLVQHGVVTTAHILWPQSLNTVSLNLGGCLSTRSFSSTFIFSLHQNCKHRKCSLVGDLRFVFHLVFHNLFRFSFCRWNDETDGFDSPIPCDGPLTETNFSPPFLAKPYVIMVRTDKPPLVASRNPLCGRSTK